MNSKQQSGLSRRGLLGAAITLAAAPLVGSALAQSQPAPAASGSPSAQVSQRRRLAVAASDQHPFLPDSLRVPAAAELFDTTASRAGRLLGAAYLRGTSRTALVDRHGRCPRCLQDQEHKRAPHLDATRGDGGNCGLWGAQLFRHDDGFQAPQSANTRRVGFRPGDFAVLRPLRLDRRPVRCAGALCVRRNQSAPAHPA